MMAPDDKAVAFINQLVHVHGTHGLQSFDLRDWQEEIVRKIFGEVDGNGKRIIRECGVWLPRKNGKSELAAALALYCLLCEPEIRGEIYSCATEKEQAALVYRTAVAMCRAIPAINERVVIQEYRYRITNPRTGSIYQALSAEASSKHGYNCSVLIYDEIHAAKDRELYDVMTTSMGARSQPLTITITTAGVYDRTRLEHQLYDYACKVRDDEVVDPHYLPVIYEADPEDDWQDEETWFKANPALGDFRDLDEMRRTAKRAAEIPGLVNEFKRLYLNIHTAQTTRWLDPKVWEEGAVAELPIADGDPCWIGIDLSATTDLTALVAVFRIEETLNDGQVLTRFAFLPYFWIPKDHALKRQKEDRVPYLAWSESKEIEFAGHTEIDQDVIRQRVYDLAERYTVQDIAIDPFNAPALIQDLQNDGFRAMKFQQSYYMMNEPSRRFAALMSDRMLLHTGNRCMNWQIGNVELKSSRDGHVRPVKASDVLRVDGVIAAIMGLQRCMHRQPVADGSYYLENDLELI